MKKQYISPELQVILVETQAMLAASGEQTLSVSNEEVTDGWASARQSHGIWEDDDED